VILEAAERLEGRDVRFTIVGGGQLEGLLRAALDRTPAPAVEWIPWLEPDALIERTRGCHVCLGIFGDTAKAAMVIPNKVFQAMAMGVPVVTRDSPAIRELVDAGAAVLCAATGAALAEAIAALDRDRSRLAAIGEAGRRAFETRAGTSALVQQFHEAIGGR
jgi:glycosyltransferase involved in cell wall biosynthesis